MKVSSEPPVIVNTTHALGFTGLCSRLVVTGLWTLLSAINFENQRTFCILNIIK